MDKMANTVKYGRKTRKSIWYLTCFLVGLSALLFNVITSFESYVWMRHMGLSPLTVQGFWYFAKRIHCALSIILILLVLSNSVTKCVVMCLTWCIFVSYGLLSAYVYCNGMALKSSVMIKCLVAFCSLSSISLQSCFFFFIFNPYGGKSIYEALRCMLFFLLGSSSASLIPRIMTSCVTAFYGMRAEDVIQTLLLLKVMLYLFSAITFVSASLTAFLVHNNSESSCSEYLTLSVGKVFGLMFNSASMRRTFLCSFGWLMSPLCGIAASSFLFNVTVKEGRQIAILDNVIHLFIICVFVIYSFSRPFAAEIQEGENEGIQGNDVEQIERGTKRDETTVTSEIIDGDKDYHNPNARKPVRLFRTPQPWCLLPSGFWNVWEDEDNKDASYLTSCATIYSVLQTVNGSNMSAEGSDDANGCLITYKDVTEAKHRLLRLLSSFIASCDASSESMMHDVGKLAKENCSYNDLKSAMDRFVGQCSCIEHYSLCWKCDICVYKSDMAAEKTSVKPQASSTSAEETTERTSAANRSGGTPSHQMNPGSSHAVGAARDGTVSLSNFVSLAMNTVNCHMGRQLSNCMEKARSLASAIRQSPELSDDLDDTSILKAAENLDYFLEQFLFLLSYLHSVNEWIILCKSMDTILERCPPLVDMMIKRHDCCKQVNFVKECNANAKCGCSSIFMLAKCVQELHQVQCEIAVNILKRSSPHGSCRMPSVSHVRVLTLIVCFFDMIMSSDLAMDVGNCRCSVKEEGKNCACRFYCDTLDRLLSNWLNDVSSSMNYGDALLRETIHLLSKVIATNTLDFNEDTPNYMNALRRFVGIGRFAADFSSKIYMANYLLEEESALTAGMLAKISLDFNQLCQCDNKCHATRGEVKSESCNCFIRECNTCRKSDECAIDILGSLSSIGTPTNSGASECLTKSCESFSAITAKMEKICEAVADKLKCANTIASTVTNFVNKIGEATTSTSGMGQHPHKSQLCKVDSNNKDVARLLLYGCNIDGRSPDSHVCTDSSTVNCEKDNCKSLSCILKTFFTTVCGENADGSRTCKCKDKGSDGCCCMWKEGLCSVLCGCADELQKLLKKLGNGVADTGNESLLCRIKTLCNTVDCVRCHLTDIDSCTKELHSMYDQYHGQLSSVAAYMCNRFNVEAEHICALQKFLDENGTVYDSALKSITKVVESTSDLSKKHEDGIFKLDDQVNTLTSNMNKTCDRLQSLQNEVKVSLKGIDAEKRNFVITPTATQQFAFRRSLKVSKKACASLRNYIRYFDIAWFLCLGICYIYGRYYHSSNGGFYTTSRNYVLLLTIKGVVMFTSYALLLTTCRSYQGYMINISLLFGLLMAVFMSFVSQWWNYTLFIKEHAKPIDRWFRLLYPTSAYGTDLSPFTWDHGLSNMFRADMNYLKNIFTSNGSVIYNHDPFATLFDDYFSFSNKPISFFGLCAWTSFEKQLRNKLIDDADEDNFKGLLDYIAFKKASLVGLDFLFSGPVSNINKVPLDLLWSAWSMQEALTLERCVAYSILEIVYKDVYGELLAWMNSVVTEEGNHMLLDSFDAKERQTLAQEALWVPNVAERYVKAQQISSMNDLFRNSFLRKWSDHRAENAHMITSPGAGDSTSGVPEVESGLLFESYSLSSAVKTWRKSREEACDRLYGGSAACNNMVTSTADLIENYLSESGVGNKALSYGDLLKYVDTSRAPRIFASSANALEPVDNDSLTDVALENPIGHCQEEYATLYSQPTMLIPEHTASTQDEDLEVDNQGRYFVGFWLKHNGVALTIDDVKRLLSYISEETKSE
ncbi:hypothetical protein, conserved [Babesia bigemina]|uniref:Uncharacterized protein n=1 Tax=Babesia bigemina TaxID=5866 RepID=A0A061DC51_BABBI|nr:hypothetical protein, conserved [Babesia bigemina]CDR95330.1 hypothetical protein, conserved [Babesia bigemina]|eukprot:XP_012767516.1 hypothetical protein, conserved [Babesia bigemina]